jgi:hypothetical protein
MFNARELKVRKFNDIRLNILFVFTSADWFRRVTACPVVGVDQRRP